MSEQRWKAEQAAIAHQWKLNKEDEQRELPMDAVLAAFVQIEPRPKTQEAPMTIDNHAIEEVVQDIMGAGIAQRSK